MINNSFVKYWMLQNVVQCDTYTEPYRYAVICIFFKIYIIIQKKTISYGKGIPRFNYLS